MRVAVFIDNSNVFKNMCTLINGGSHGWVKQYNPLYLSEKLAGNRELVLVNFYCSPPPQELFLRNPTAYNSQNAYYAKVGKLKGVDLKFAALTGNGGTLAEKNLDTQLVSDVVLLAATNAYDRAIIVSNDGDFVSAVDGARQLGKKVEIAHFKSKFSMALKQSADLTRRLRPAYFIPIDQKQEQLL